MAIDYATVSGPNGFRYTFTDEDLLWACRMLWGEAGNLSWQTYEGEAILWTTLQRFVKRHFLVGESTYTESMRRFSQPINPIWYEGGSRDPDPGFVNDDEARRAYILQMDMEDFRPEIVSLAIRFMTGKVPNRAYAGLVDFNMAGKGGGPGDVGPIRVPGLTNTANWFYRETDTVDWTTSTVTISNPGLRKAIVGTLLGVGLIGGIIVWRGRSARR